VKKVSVFFALSYIIVFVFTAPALCSVETKKKETLEVIVTAAADAGLSVLDALANKLAAEAIRQNLGDGEALAKLVTPLINDYISDFIKQYVPAYIGGNINTDSWISPDIIRKIADEIAGTGFYAKITDYSASGILEIINLGAIRDGIIKTCTDTIWNDGNPSAFYYANDTWRLPAVSLNVSLRIASGGVNQVNLKYQSIDFHSVFRNAAARALNEAIDEKKAELAELIKESIPNWIR
jgi:hypothetical protein